MAPFLKKYRLKIKQDEQFAYKLKESGLVTAWGGQQIYFPKDIARRNARMYDEFKGDNAPDLASKYNLSTAAVYQIIASERERRRMKQCSLMDFVPSNGHIAGEVRHG